MLGRVNFRTGTWSDPNVSCDIGVSQIRLLIKARDSVNYPRLSEASVGAFMFQRQGLPLRLVWQSKPIQFSIRYTCSSVGYARYLYDICISWPAQALRFFLGLDITPYDLQGDLPCRGKKVGRRPKYSSPQVLFHYQRKLLFTSLIKIPGQYLLPVFYAHHHVALNGIH